MLGTGVARHGLNPAAAHDAAGAILGQMVTREATVLHRGGQRRRRGLDRPPGAAEDVDLTTRVEPEPIEVIVHWLDLSQRPDVVVHAIQPASARKMSWNASTVGRSAFCSRRRSPGRIFDLRALQLRTDIARRNLAVQERTLAFTRERLGAGVAGDLDVSRVASLVATTRAQLPDLEDRTKQAIRRLGILLGREPDALASELSPAAPIPRPPVRVAVGLLSMLLRRRPDVRAAERRVAAATAKIGVATADLYPRFALAGTIGQFDVNSVANFFMGDNRYFGFGPTIRWDVFDAGRTHARIDIERARTDGAAAEYRKTVLAARAEAQNALGMFDTEQDRRASLAEAVAADRSAVDTANQLYRQGVADFMSVLDAERSLAASEVALAQSDRTIGTNLVALYKAFGGGWESTEAQVAAQPQSRR